MSEGSQVDSRSRFDLAETTLADPQISPEPFAYYAEARRQDPVRLDPGIGYYWITRRDQVMDAATDSDRFSSMTDLQFRATYRPRAQKVWDDAGIELHYTLLTSDPPHHKDYRQFAQAMFTPIRVKQLATRIEALVHELIDGFIDEGKVAFDQAFAAALPSTIVCQEYGFPREDGSKFKAWADSVLQLQTPGISEDEEVELVTRVTELMAYLKRHLERPRLPEEGRIMYDLAMLNRLDGTPFTLMERAWMAIAIFIGGVDTTATMLVSMINYLCLHPQLQDELRGDEEKIGNFIEEILRLHGPVQSIARRAKVDFAYGGKAIAQGADIMLCLGSANRDEEYWTEPDKLDLDRPNVRQHLSFGYGRHVCVGMHLARQELQIAMRAILDRMGDIRFQNPAAPPCYMPAAIFHFMDSMPITFTKRA